MKNIFYVSGYRFHTKDKNKFLMVGYFGEDFAENGHLLFQMDGKDLFCEVNERKLDVIEFKVSEGKYVTKEYFFWVQLPPQWKEHEKLQVFYCSENQQEHVLTLSCDELRIREHDIIKHIDEYKVTKEGFQIKGWYGTEKETSLHVFDMKGRKLDMKFHYGKRMDVLRAYPENKENEIVGYTASYDGKIPKEIIVRYKREGKQLDEPIVLKESKAEKIVTKSKDILHKTMAYYRHFGVKATLIRVVDKVIHREIGSYEEWWRRHEPSKGVLQKQRKEVFPLMPKISIVVPLYKTPEKYLKEMIASVEKQSYQNWELCLSDGSGENSPLKKLLLAYEKKDSRIRVIHNEKQLHISDNTNEALKVCTGDFIAYADHDDLLTPNALYECVAAINNDPEIEMLYSDEDKINMAGTEHFLPHFKSDFNIDLLRCVNYFCHLVVVKRSLFEHTGMLKAEYDGSQDYDFVLRCVENTTKIKHIPKVLYHWRAHQDSTAENPESKSYGVEAGANAIRAHYERVGINAVVEPLQSAGFYRSRYILSEEPLVSIIIPNKDHVEDLKKCIESIEEKSTYENIEYIVVENNSQNKETFEYYQELEKKNKKVHIVHWDNKGFNYSAINNFGVKHARGEYLLLLNNDTEILNSDCIEELLGYCMRPDVGAVGARLYYEDGTIQHAGVIIGIGGVAGHSFKGFPREHPGYFGRAILVQDLSAVTAACLMVKRSVYEEVGGLDEELAVAFNDIDFCLKVRKAGHLIVYNPYAELMHYESKSRGYEDTHEKLQRFLSEIQFFRERWHDFLEVGDPYYNPNLALDRHDFSINMVMNSEGR